MLFKLSFNALPGCVDIGPAGACIHYGGKRG